VTRKTTQNLKGNFDDAKACYTCCVVRNNMTCVLIEQLSVEYEFDVTLPEDILMLTVDLYNCNHLMIPRTYDEKGQKERTMIYRTIHRKLMIEQHEHHQKPEMNSVFRKG
jgi:hypothetical protein